MDFGRMLVSMVSVELLRRGYETYAGVLYKREIGFVAMRGTEKLCLKVSDDISSPETFERECPSPLSIPNARADEIRRWRPAT